MTATLAGLCAACSVLVLPARTAGRRLESLFPAPARGARRRRRWAVDSWPTLGPAVTAAVAGAVLVRSPVLTGLLPLIVWRGTAAWRRRRARTSAERRRGETVAVCLALRAELRGGQDARAALRAAVEGTAPELARRVVGPLAAGDDLVPVLRAAAREPGREAMSYLAACWHASEGGAGMAAAVGRLAVGLREGETQRREVAAELAGVRASARMLAALPVAGVILGTALGARPVGVLLHTVAGQVCLLLGAGCVIGGLAWMELIVRGAEARA